MVQEGYDKVCPFHADLSWNLQLAQYRDGFFKIPAINNWIVVVNGPKLIEEVLSAPIEQLSFAASVKEVGCPPMLIRQRYLHRPVQMLQTRYIFGPTVEESPIDPTIIRHTATRNLGVRFVDVRDEIMTALEEYIPLKDGGTLCVNSVNP